jgi:2-keto-3-deoxy-L-rhamnonate aldolase RhmA
MASLLADDQAVFGIFSQQKTPEEGAELVANREPDFIFYSMETGPFDIPRMQAFMEGMLDNAGPEGTHATALRIPPIRDGHDEARERVALGIESGVDSIVFPHVETAEEAMLAVQMMGNNGWPSNEQGKLVNVLLIEDQVGVANAREIVNTPGVSVVIPGPGDLSRAYGRDQEATENAI